MVPGSIHRARAGARRAITLAVASALGLAACSASNLPPGGRLTASQQILASEAVDRALAKIDWPAMDGRKVFVETGAPAAEPERGYLDSAIDAALVRRGAILTDDLGSADYVLVVLGKAVGIDASRTFFGIPAVESALLPIGLPEIALYESSREEGYVKLETVLSDRDDGDLLAQSGPVESETWTQSRTILLFDSYETNTSKEE